VRWRTDVWSALTVGRPLEAYLSVANATLAPLDIVVRLALSTGNTRTERATVPVGVSAGWKMRNLYGSQVSNLAALVAGLTVTCAGGTVACPASVTWMTAPTCEVP
jgi:hypothetical protein